MTDVIYRFADPAALAASSVSGAFEGEAVDARDGFIHCSTRDQLAGTLAAHFAGVDRIALAEIDAGALGDALKWERSRDGETFPHVYGPIPFAAIRSIHLMHRDADGAWRLPEELA
jgi:beta-hydroxylase